MSVQHAYDDWSSSYDSDENRTRDLDQQVTKEALAGGRVDSILELGSGTGKNTLFLAQIGSSIHALDFSEGMIEKAREKVKAENVEFSLADLTEQWPCESEAYDLVVCNLVLEHLQDLRWVFSEVSRVLRAGGLFLLNELHPFRQYEGKKARFRRGGDVIDIPAFIHHISDFLRAASDQGLLLQKLDERWHNEDPDGTTPRLVMFLFKKDKTAQMKPSDG